MDERLFPVADIRPAEPHVFRHRSLSLPTAGVRKEETRRNNVPSRLLLSSFLEGGLPQPFTAIFLRVREDPAAHTGAANAISSASTSSGLVSYRVTSRISVPSTPGMGVQR